MADKMRSVCFTLDFDGMSLQLGALGSQNTSVISRGEFGATGLSRVLTLAEKYELPLTVAVPGHTAYCYPDLVKRLVSEGHEIVHHGWVHENPLKFSRDDERRNLEKGFAAIEWAAGYRPRGYRSPAWDLSENSIELLTEAGFVYDSSCMASDFYPYYLRKGDKASFTEPYVFGELSDLVEVPVSWALDDWPAFEYIMGGGGQGLKPPSVVRETWEADFDYFASSCPQGVFNLTCHPQVIGRGGRLAMYEEFIKHVKAADNVRLETLGSFVDRWKSDNPLPQWKRENPWFAGEQAFKSEDVAVS